MIFDTQPEHVTHALVDDDIHSVRILHGRSKALSTDPAMRQLVEPSICVWAIGDLVNLIEFPGIWITAYVAKVFQG